MYPYLPVHRFVIVIFLGGTRSRSSLFPFGQAPFHQHFSSGMPFVCTLSIDRLRFCLFLRGKFALTLALTRQPVALLPSQAGLHPALCQWALKTSHNSSLPWNRSQHSHSIAIHAGFSALGWSMVQVMMPRSSPQTDKSIWCQGLKELSTISETVALQMS